MEVLIIPNTLLLPWQHFLIIEYKERSPKKNQQLIANIKRNFLFHLLAFFFSVLALIRAIEEFTIEKLNSYDGKYELKQYIYNQDVNDVL